MDVQNICRLSFYLLPAVLQRCFFLLILLGILMVPSSAQNTEKPPAILVVHPPNEQFIKAKNGLGEELGSHYQLESMVVTQGTTLEEFVRKIDDTEPRLLVLMDSRPVGFYRLYQDNLESEREPVPALALMTLYLDKQLVNVKNATGILYEIPGLTTVTQLRSLLQGPVDRVGVIYRGALRDFFLTQKSHCAQWKIDLVGYEIPARSQNYSRHIRRGLRELLKDEKVDALWIINDTSLVNTYLLSRAWTPILDDYKTPVVVSVPRLIAKEVAVGHLAVVPDSFELGLQAGELVDRIREEGWQPNLIELQNPISVHKLLNLKHLDDDSILFNEDALLEMDVVQGTEKNED